MGETRRLLPFFEVASQFPTLSPTADSSHHQDSVMFSGTMTVQTARVTVTAVRARRIAELHGGNGREPGVDDRPDDVRVATALRLCTLALTAA